ncbi:protein phosphatase 2C domain-containing protein [Actinoallomurus purpureus]|uniref:protein phosphatase 2C domain-containing protein n=1 Tax=Actinoallomurus purpureus TaxID=478114 RepID=UPI0027E26D74|nr:protein phosphatase 2C domain-containing protein [Actinoallomurus purpureus]
MRVWLASAPGSTERLNEDFVAASNDVVVLLDGAGTPTGTESGCSHGVAWYARQLGAQLLIEASVTPRRPLTEALAVGINRVRDMHADTCDLTHPGTPSATAIAVRRNGRDLEYLVLADSVLVLDVLDGAPTVVTDDRLAQTSRTLRSEMDALPTGSPEHAKALRSYTESLASYRNTEGGFWVANTDPAAATHALTGSLPADTVRAAALLSDGASRLVDRFGLTDWTDTLKLLGEEGPAELIRRVRVAEDSDPHGERWPRGKANDDASAAYCWLSGIRSDPEPVAPSVAPTAKSKGPFLELERAFDLVRSRRDSNPQPSDP